MAAGLSLPKENVELFRQRINELCTLSDKELIPKIRIDVPMPMDYVSMDLVREFALLEPFGKGNAKPVFADRGIRMKRLYSVGKMRRIWKMTLVTAGGNEVSGIYFGDPEEFLSDLTEGFGSQAVEDALRGADNPILLSVIYYPRINTYRMEESLQFEIQYYRISGRQ